MSIDHGKLLAMANGVKQHITWRENGVSRVPSLAEMREWESTFRALAQPAETRVRCIDCTEPVGNTAVCLVCADLRCESVANATGKAQSAEAVEGLREFIAAQTPLPADMAAFVSANWEKYADFHEPPAEAVDTGALTNLLSMLRDRESAALYGWPRWFDMCADELDSFLISTGSVQDSSAPQRFESEATTGPHSQTAAISGNCTGPTHDAAQGAVEGGLGRFGHHPDPATDFEVEVESLQGRLFNARHGIAKMGEQPETVGAVTDAIERAMRFKVGGDPGAVYAKSLLRAQGDDETAWREGWAMAYSGAQYLYGDDGELQDNRWPMIDWRRDSAMEIRQKIYERGMRALAAAPSQEGE